MGEDRRGRVSYVIGPDGSPLTMADLPPPNTKRWVIRRKAEVVAAVRGGLLSLDEACRRQQVGEGWFRSLDEVPAQAISMSIRQIMKSAAVLCTVPDLRKAESVRGAVEGPVTNRLPASILQQHPHCDFYLDVQAASLLKKQR